MRRDFSAMAPPESPLALMERLLGIGDAAGALRIADQLIAQSKRSFPGWLGRGCANLNLGRIADADAALDVALRLSPADPQANLLQGMVDQRLGRIESAIDRLRRVAASRTPQAVEAAVTLAEVYWYAHRREELSNFIAAGGVWTKDPRAALSIARVRATNDPEGGLSELIAISERERNPVLRRVAGFEAVAMLDKGGRYREAFDLATALHRDTPPFDLEGMLIPLREQQVMVEKGTNWITPRVDPVAGVSMVVGLPRSGTTLLEQMLDRHPAIGGIGEYDGVEILGGELVSLGAWPRRIGMVPRDTLLALQHRYLEGANRLKRAGTAWSFDKNLLAWRWLPAIAAVLPGAVYFHVARDPRDAAISTFLSYFHPVHCGWTASLSSLRRVAELERVLVPRALEVLKLSHESIVYEDLVADPAGHAQQCLHRLALPMDVNVVSPERNTRAVFTLSHEQVRRPINSASIERWRNYEFAFDGSWDALAGMHHARRQSASARYRP